MLVLAVTVFSACCVIWSRPPAQAEPREPEWSSESQNWKAENWKVSDAPYHLILADLTQKMALHQLRKADLIQYQDEWSQSQQNSQALFRWVCAANLLYSLVTHDATLPEHYDHKPQGYLGIAAAYRDFPLTHSYEFDKAHLIFDINTGDDDYDLMPTVKRFYDHNHHDTAIMHIYAVMLANSDQPSDNLLSTKIADRLVVAVPNVAMNHVLFGWCHYSEYWRTFCHADYVKASQGYHDFLKMTPSSDPFRQQAIHFLANMKHR